jgi:hypothetical protein
MTTFRNRSEKLILCDASGMAQLSRIPCPSHYSNYQDGCRLRWNSKTVPAKLAA